MPVVLSSKHVAMVGEFWVKLGEVYPNPSGTVTCPLAAHPPSSAV